MQKTFFSTLIILTPCVALNSYANGKTPAATSAKPVAAPSAKPAADTTVTVDTTKPADPFAFGDFTWLNGNDRRHTQLLDSKYFTGEFLLDANYTASNQHPIDHTVIGSTTLARDNEFEVNLVAAGGDFHYDNVIGRLLLQLGTRSTVVPRNDGSVFHGQYDLAGAYRYFSEGYGGYHFDVWDGINVEAGIFMSYVGLFSYYNAENWTYQPSYTSDNTPWFFNGMRIQIFPSDKLKIEPWIINGWQSYAKFNNAPGLGMQILWRPNDWFQLISNNYEGHDTQDSSDRLRLHTDNSLEFKYYDRPGSFLDKMACSLTQDVGEETGGGVNGFHSSPTLGPAQFFISGMAYNRFWMSNDHFGTTIGAGYIHNPGRYLVLAPTGEASPYPNQYNPTQPISPNAFAIDEPGTQFTGWDATISCDWMPNDDEQWMLQFDYRSASVPYFAGPGGVTSPDGYTTTAVPAGWTPDLVKSEARIVGAFLIRF